VIGFAYYCSDCFSGAFHPGLFFGHFVFSWHISIL
jgi:hypothetical protein